MLGEELLGRLTVSVHAGAEEAVDVVAVVRRASSHDQGRVLIPAGPHRPAKGGHAPIVVVGIGVGAGAEEGSDDIGRGVDHPVGQRLGRLPCRLGTVVLHGVE